MSKDRLTSRQRRRRESIERERRANTPFKTQAEINAAVMRHVKGVAGPVPPGANNQASGTIEGFAAAGVAIIGHLKLVGEANVPNGFGDGKTGSPEKWARTAEGRNAIETHRTAYSCGEDALNVRQSADRVIAAARRLLHVKCSPALGPSINNLAARIEEWAGSGYSKLFIGDTRAIPEDEMQVYTNDGHALVNELDDPQPVRLQPSPRGDGDSDLAGAGDSYEYVSRNAITDATGINKGQLSKKIQSGVVEGETGKGGRVNLESFASYQWPEDPDERDDGIGRIMSVERKLRNQVAPK